MVVKILISLIIKFIETLLKYRIIKEFYVLSLPTRYSTKVEQATKLPKCS